MNVRTIWGMLLTAILVSLFALQGPYVVVAQEALSTPDAAGATDSQGQAIAFSAAPDGASDLSPFRLEVDAGATVEATLVVANGAETPIELHNYAADVMTRVNGGFQVAPEGTREAPHVSGWLDIETAPYLVNPGEQVEIKVTVSAPADAKPGEYMAALATETVESAAIAGTGAFRQITRKVNAVVITVPGTVAAGFTLGAPAIELTEGMTTVTAPIENTGNVRVRPHGTITIYDVAGTPVAAIPVKLDSVYAWTSTIIQYSVAKALPAGTYNVEIELTDDETGAVASLPGTLVVTSSVQP